LGSLKRIEMVPIPVPTQKNGTAAPVLVWFLKEKKISFWFGSQFWNSYPVLVQLLGDTVQIHQLLTPD
jgi:hypothetical protein